MSWPRFASALALGLALAIPTAFSLADSSRGGYAPDPAGVASKKQWIFEVQVRQGNPTLGTVRSVVLDKPTTSARVLGRFAVEFWIGKELLDRVRFDVPLLDDPLRRKNRRVGAPEFLVNTRLSVRMTDQERATSVVFVDRATGEVQYFAWPPGSDGRLTPIAAPAASAADAGADAPVVDASPRGDGG